MEDNSNEIYLYLYDENGKYIDKEPAELDEWQTSIKGSPVYRAKSFATFEIPEIQEGYTPYIQEDGKWKLIANPSLDDEKEEKELAAKIIFASKRDAIRFISVNNNIYGFDTESEDITNFMAAWKAADISGSTMYKVWLDKENKGIVTLTSEDFATIFKCVRDSQFEAYAWLQNKINEIERCTSEEELMKVSLEEDEVASINED